MAKFNAYNAARARIRAEQRRAAVDRQYNRQKYGVDTVHSTRAPTSARAQAQSALRREHDQQRAKVNYNREKYGQDENPRDVADRYRDNIGSVVQGTQNVTNSLGGIPGSRAVGAVAGSLGNIASGAAQGGAMGGPIGAAVGAAKAALGEFVKALGSAVNKINDFASIAVKYNPQAAQAGAQAQVRGIQGDIRRSNYLGPELAGMIDARSRLEQKGEDLLAKLVKPLIPRLTQFMENAIQFLDWAEPFAIDSINSVIKQLNELIDGLTALVKFLRIDGVYFNKIDLIEKNTRQKEGDTPFDALLKLPQLQTSARPADDFRPAGGGGPGIPGLQGPPGGFFRAFGFNIG